MNLSIRTRQAYSEIDEFIELLTEEQKNEIPKELRDFFKEEKDKSYSKKINASIPIKDQNLKRETLALIALLNLQYWCKDEEEKKRLKSIYIKNENKYQEMLRKKYNPNDVFKKKEEKDEELELKKVNKKDNLQLIEYKESFLIKIKKILKRLFK